MNIEDFRSVDATGRLSQAESKGSPRPPARCCL